MHNPSLSSTAAVRQLMAAGIWYTTPQLQKGVKYLTGKMRSESGISARVRELRKIYTIESRPKKGSTSYEYRLLDS